MATLQIPGEVTFTTSDIASADKLGVIRVGDGLFVDESGVLSAQPGSVDLSGYVTDAELDTALAGKSDAEHTHTSTEITDFNAAVDARIENIVGASPTALDTLNELAAALGDDPNFATTITTQLGTKLGQSQVDDRSKLLIPCAINFTADADAYVPAYEAMTVNLSVAKIGTGTLSYAKSTAAAPGTFTSTSLPATLEVGAWLKVTLTGCTSFAAIALRRTA